MVFFVTGGSKGVGEGVVRALVAAGHDVAFTWRHGGERAQSVVDALRTAYPGRKVRAYPLDVRDPDAIDAVVDQALEEVGDVDAVVCNAAVNLDDLAVSMSDEAWREVIDTNLTGSFFVARRLLSTFLGKRRGRLIFVSSIAQRGISGQANYCASKGGLVALSAALAKEYGRRGITSNVLVLGVMDSGMATVGLAPEYREFSDRFTPVGRPGTADDVTAAILFLASDGAAYVTGQEIGVNGGLEWGP